MKLRRSLIFLKMNSPIFCGVAALTYGHESPIDQVLLTGVIENANDIFAVAIMPNLAQTKRRG